MSQYRRSSSSSEDDEVEEPFTSRINLPKVDLNTKKLNNKPYPKNIVKAGKKLTSNNKAVRFPDTYNPRDTIISNESNTQTQSSSDSESSIREGNSAQRTSGESNLPSFKFHIDEFKGEPIDAGNQDDDDEDDEDEEARNTVAELQSHHPHFEQYPHDTTDSSDSDSDSNNDSNKSSSDSSHPQQPIEGRSNSFHQFISRKASNQSRNSRDSRSIRNEIDITDQLKRHPSITSSTKNSFGENTKQNFKDILRKIALTDQAYSAPEYAAQDALQDSGVSRSDTFIGRVLNMGGNGGLGGGGMAPGGSRSSREKPIDEEEEIGGGSGSHIGEDDNLIELQKLHFDQINDEARNLISIHVPDAKNLLAEEKLNRSGSRSNNNNISSSSNNDNFTTPNNDNNNNFNNDNINSNEIPSTSYPASEDESPESDHHFYQPNPDYNVHAGVVNDLHDNDYLMLDDDEGGDGYIAPPKQVHAGVLSSLLKLYQNPQEIKSTTSVASSTTLDNVPPDFDIHDESFYDNKNSSSATVDLKKFKNGFKKSGKYASHLPGKIIGAPGKFATHLTSPGNHQKANSRPPSISDESIFDDEKGGDGNEMDTGDANLPSFQNARPKAPKRSTSGGGKVPQNFSKKLKQHKRQQNERLKITVHIADILQRQRFIMRMCRALMLFGAPTHRLEDYMIMTSRVLEIDGQFIYFPGCMIVAFGDAATRTSEVHLVRCAQGLNLSKLSDTHAIYKGVIHDLMGVEEAAAKLEELLKKKNLYPPWVCVFLYGLGSASVCPFAFSGNWYDVPIAFGIGLCVGYLQFFVSSISNLYSSVFEVTASIVVSFIARAIGSIRDGNIFCFGAIAQGSLALILPGYIILCGSLELQSKNLVAGSVRMFYAIIYSLFLGFGITLGAALYGWVDDNATDKAVCDADHPIDDKWRILFVPLFSLCLGLINQARWRQIPVMLFISSVGYIGNYYAGKHFQNVTEFTAAIGAFIIGVLGNMYSRIWKGMAVSAMLPAIFVQVPSGIASKSTLLSGISSANLLTNSNGSTTTSSSSSSTDTSSLSFGATMVEVSIGISVGLFAAALVVYPFGKRKTSLFTL